MKIFSGNSNLELSQKICQHLNIQLSDAKITKFADGEILIPGKAFQDGTLRFGGYAVDGEFSFGKGDSEFKTTGIDDTKPVYVYEYKDGDKTIRQFVQF